MQCFGHLDHLKAMASETVDEKSCLYSYLRNLRLWGYIFLGSRNISQPIITDVTTAVHVKVIKKKQSSQRNLLFLEMNKMHFSREGTPHQEMLRSLVVTLAPVEVESVQYVLSLQSPSGQTRPMERRWFQLYIEGVAIVLQRNVDQLKNKVHYLLFFFFFAFS